jgi:hypothetical protein
VLRLSTQAEVFVKINELRGMMDDGRRMMDEGF